MSNTSGVSKSVSKPNEDEKRLEQEAIQELLREAKRGEERSTTMGAGGWIKSTVPKMNKQFLHRTLASVNHSHRVVSTKHKSAQTTRDSSRKNERNSTNQNSQLRNESRRKIKDSIRDEKSRKSTPYDRKNNQLNSSHK